MDQSSLIGEKNHFYLACCFTDTVKHERKHQAVEVVETLGLCANQHQRNIGKGNQCLHNVYFIGVPHAPELLIC